MMGLVPSVNSMLDYQCTQVELRILISTSDPPHLLVCRSCTDYCYSVPYDGIVLCSFNFRSCEAHSSCTQLCPIITAAWVIWYFGRHAIDTIPLDASASQRSCFSCCEKLSTFLYSYCI
ncbi:hypothetical protein M413DRAFT_184096 [Hebeloma cylindrosporum]|uniref:Uncharacterized protein n=1 Tax=Hebeloma cylindrosporum TaxID=76867 RepID=A0A0C3C887_HEBCY|nr:hypothetical protein M413DRAFT_184096 [Hebeloma cylindrosporum h7]